MRLSALSLIVAASILTACGGGGSSTVDKTPPETLPSIATPDPAAEQNKQRDAINDALTAASSAVAKVNNTAGNDVVTAADTEIDKLRTAIESAENLSKDDLDSFQKRLDDLDSLLANAKSNRKTAIATMETAAEESKQRNAITTALEAASSAVADVDNDAGNDVVTKADNAIAKVNEEITRADNLSEDEEATFREILDAIESALRTAKTNRDSEIARQAQIVADEEAKRRNDAAIAIADAKKYFGAIKIFNPQSSPLNITSNRITVTPANGSAVTFSTDPIEEKGWIDKKYTKNENNVVTEVSVYADLNPTPGDPFNSANKYLNDLDSDGYLLFEPINSFTPDPMLISSSDSRLPTTGSKIFDNIKFSGSYDGVDGEYSCSDDKSTNKCTVEVKGNTPADALELTSGSPNRWKFKPTSPKAPTISPPDNEYASYGWWSYKPAGDGTGWEVSAFHDYIGTPPSFPGGFTFNQLTGTATYIGKAIGWYALSSDTDGINDSGNFSADVNLTAKFGDASDSGSISGNITNFNHNTLNWHVELQETKDIDATGIINATSTSNAVWSIDGKKINPNCMDCTWKGNFYDPSSVTTQNNTPRTVIGSFYTEYGKDGKMVGSFGAKTKE